MADNLIPKDELIELKSASTVKAVADSAVRIIEKQACAQAINTAANTGSHSVIFDHPMSKQLQDELKTLGYEFHPVANSADPTKHWVIMGF